MTVFEPLPRAEVIQAVERKHPRRIPLIMAKWWGEGFSELHGEMLSHFDQYPEDAVLCLIEPFRYEEMNLPWELHLTGAHDTRAVLPDWEMLDELIAHLPDPEQDLQFEKALEMAQWAHEHDRYFIFGWWRLFFERPWEIRGMTNLLMDYVAYPEEVHKLYDALCETYLAYLRRALREFQFDGFWTSDDLGHQKQLFMSPKMFRTFHKPRYEQIGALLREHNLHWWLHSCGNNFGILGDLVDAGVTVFHPVQKHTMDEQLVAKQFGERLTFLVGFDVQQILINGRPEEVRAEVRHLIDTFDRPDGGMCLAAGNGILPGTPLENIDAFLDEALVYGEIKRTAR
ncbi:MAG TPA: uroporphyrinogen decarboxylase family protein [Anaerolineales bacterium]|nr:uroporphyrinogen decarboxylase family protein [Anaerolineales bacterium]